MSAVGSQGLPQSDSQQLLESLCEAPDLQRSLTHQEINGVRRIVKIEYTSSSLDSSYGESVKLTRDFIYQESDPFDLIQIKDSLTVT